MLKNFGVIAFCAAMTFGCQAPDHVSISGSTTVLPAISKASEAYSALTGETLIVNAGGSGTGFNQLAEGQTDIGMMSRAITDSEFERFPNLIFNVVPIGIDAVVPVVSSEIYDAGVTALSAADLAAIYKGEIDNWQVFGGPDKQILVIDKEASSGTRHIFMRYIFGDIHADAPGADLVLGANNEEQTALTQSDSAIGMLSHAWMNSDVKGLAILVDDARIEPSLENIQSGQFPITRDLIVITRSDIRPKAQGFITYLLSPEGQAFVEASGYVKIAN